MRDASANPKACIEGTGAVLGNTQRLYDGATTAGIGGALVYGQKGPIANGSGAVLDKSMDWRDRHVTLSMLGSYDGGGTDILPGNAGAEVLVVPQIPAAADIDKFTHKPICQGLWLPGPGWLWATGSPATHCVAQFWRPGNGGVIDAVYVFADSTTGWLNIYNNSGAAFGVVWMALAGPQIGVQVPVH